MEKMWKTYVGFLSAVLQIKPESIRETCILNTNLRKEYEDDKQGILDVRLLMDDDVEIDIEIQLSELKEEFDMPAQKNPYIESAYEHLQVISQDKQKRMEYEAREKAVRDYNQGMYEAEERGVKRGREEGRKEGWQDGHAEASIHIAKNMMGLGIPLEDISKYTGLPMEFISSIQK